MVLRVVACLHMHNWTTHLRRCRVKLSSVGGRGIVCTEFLALVHCNSCRVCLVLTPCRLITKFEHVHLCSSVNTNSAPMLHNGWYVHALSINISNIFLVPLSIKSASYAASSDIVYGKENIAQLRGHFLVQLVNWYKASTISVDSYGTLPVDM